MTPNGAVLFASIVIIAALAASSPKGLVILCVLTAVMAVIEVRGRAISALLRTAVVVLPLAAFMTFVWVGIVGRAPAEIAAGEAGTRTAAALYVLFICLRLLLIVLAIQLVILRFDRLTPLQFICALRLPAIAKRLLVLTLSLIETLRHAIDRARTALIAAGLVTRRPSLRNMLNGWVLVQTVWLSAITIVIGRMRDKWPVENTLGLLDGMLQRNEPQRLSWDDGIWLPVAVGAAFIAAGVR
jgi:hypothetical protein